MQHPASPV
jgi:hypothetical protein